MFVILMTCVIRDGDRFYPQLFLVKVWWMMNDRVYDEQT